MSYFRDLKPTELNEVLSRAILMGYDSEMISSIIAQGADVNASFMGETPLMNAANNLKLLRTLLSAGAKVNEETLLGKAALFYAIQFGDIHCVKMLLDAGANINHALHSQLSEELSENGGHLPRFYLVNNVLSFTPLIYAQRYAHHDVVQHLVNRGAKIGKANPTKIKEWIKEGKLELA